jgi:hypothetical protein
VSLLLRFRFVQALAASPKYLRLFECLCRGLCPSFEASYSGPPRAPASVQTHSNDSPPLVVRARPTGPRFARPEDRLLCRASTKIAQGLSRASWMAGTRPATND